MSWIQTYTGGRFWPLEPLAVDVRVEDIAHALSLVCRFTGHVREFYSVAQHSVLVSHACDPADALWGLLHDASEAYICDVARPIKPALANYAAIERKIMLAVCERFALPDVEPESVKRADLVLLATEARDLMPGRGEGWSWPNGEPERLLTVIQPWPPAYAERMFLERLHALGAS